MARRKQQSGKNSEVDLASNGSGSELQNRPATSSTTATRKRQSKASTKVTQMLHQSPDEGIHPIQKKPVKTKRATSGGDIQSSQGKRKKFRTPKEPTASDELKWLSVEPFETGHLESENPESSADGVKKVQKRKRRSKPSWSAAATNKKKATTKRAVGSAGNATDGKVRQKRLSKKAVVEKQSMELPVQALHPHSSPLPEPTQKASTSAGAEPTDLSNESGLQINRLKVLKLGGDMEDAIQIIISYLAGRKELTVEEDLKRREHEQTVEESKLKDAKEALVKLGLKLQTYSNKLRSDKEQADSNGHNLDGLNDEVSRVNSGIDVLLTVGQKIETEKERLQMKRLELALQRVGFERQRCAVSKPTGQ